MIYSLRLETALLWTGALLFATHAYALLQGAAVQRWLKAFPRSRPAGAVLFTSAALWFLWIIGTSDLGEFTDMRVKFMAVTVGLYVLTLRYVGEFLAVRALGMLLLLLAEPVLESAWLRPEQGRLLLVALAYAWIVAGLFCIGKPYLLRDAIGWGTASSGRWKAAALSGMVFGALLLGVRASL